MKRDVALMKLVKYHVNVTVLPLIINETDGFYTIFSRRLTKLWQKAQSAGVAPEVNLMITQARKHAKGIHSGFETQGRPHQKSKTGVLVAPQKGTDVPQNFFKKLYKVNLSLTKL